MCIQNNSSLAEIVQPEQTIAVVGLSPKPVRPSHQVARYMMEAGYEIIPVNPGQDEILGKKCYPDLESIPLPVDIVDVFRNPRDLPPIVEGAIKIGARVLWLQLGVVNEEAAARAQAAGLTVVMDRCLKTEHQRLVAGGAGIL